MNIKEYFIIVFMMLSSILFLSISAGPEVSMPENHITKTWKGSASNLKDPFIKIVTTQEEWSDLWKRAFDTPPPEVNFNKYVVACVFLGQGADWLYAITFGEPFTRSNTWVIPYECAELVLELAKPFKASGQYSMQLFDKKKGYSVILEKKSSTF